MNCFTAHAKIVSQHDFGNRFNQPKRDWTWRSGGLGLPSGTAQVLLDELRQERA